MLISRSLPLIHELLSLNGWLLAQNWSVSGIIRSYLVAAEGLEKRSL